MASFPPPPPPPNNNENNSSDAALFRRDFSASLAQALQEAEARQPTRAERVEETYRLLSHDDPTRYTADGCRALAVALTENNNRAAAATTYAPQTQTTYALSERLVEGIRQVYHRHDNQQKSTSSSHPEQQQPDDAEATAAGAAASSSSDTLMATPPEAASVSSPAMAVACACLAWTVHGRIPLLCAQSRTLPEAARYLGSYRGPPSLPDVDNDDDDDLPREREEGTEEEAPATAAVMNGNGHAPHRGNGDDDLDEVWAAESDPSDFDYGEEDGAAAALDESAWIRAMEEANNPAHQSDVPPDTDWPDIAQAISNLVPQLHYRYLAPLTATTDWTRLGVAEQLAQLTLTLLLPEEKSANPVLQQKPPHHWQQLALHPLHALRDAALDRPATACWGDYLQLLQALLQADRYAHRPAAVATASTTTLVPATWVGLSALSSLCSDVATEDAKRIPASARASLREAVLLAADDLAHILQSAARSDAAAALPWTFLPLWGVLTTTKTSTFVPLAPAQAQILLNSGVFSQWLLWWKRLPAVPDAHGSDDSPLCHAMEESLWDLARAAPALLGKYVWRFPGWAAHATKVPATIADVTTSTTTSNRLPRTLLWNLLGGHLTGGAATTASTTGRLRNISNAKSNKAAAASAPASPPTAETCRTQAWTLWQQLLLDAHAVLSQWKEACTRKEGATAAATGIDNAERLPIEEQEDRDLEQQAAILAHFSTVVQALASSSILVAQFQTLSTGGTVEATKLTQPLQTVLASWPAMPAADEAKMSPKVKVEDDDGSSTQRLPSLSEEDPDDDRSPEQRQRRRQHVRYAAVNATRKSLKTLQSMSLTTAGPSATAPFSSKAD